MVNSRMVWQILLVLIVSFTAGYFTVGAGQGILGDWSGDEGSYLSLAWASKDNTCTGEKPDYPEECIQCNNDSGEYEVKNTCPLEKCGDWMVRDAPSAVPATTDKEAKFKFAIKKEEGFRDVKKTKSYSEGDEEGNKREKWIVNVTCDGNREEVELEAELDVVALKNIKPEDPQTVAFDEEGEVEAFELTPITEPDGYGDHVEWRWNDTEFDDEIKPNESAQDEIDGRLALNGQKGDKEQGPRGTAIKIIFPDNPDVTTAGENDDDSITYELLPEDADGVQGTVEVQLTSSNDAEVTLHELEDQQPGEHEVGFNWDELEEEEYEEVDGSWDVGDAVSEAELTDLSPTFEFLGFYRHTRYNLPEEDNCDGDDTDVMLMDGGTQQQCRNTRSHVQMNSDFVSAAGTQGSGTSSDHGPVAHDEECHDQMEDDFDPNDVNDDENWDIDTNFENEDLWNRLQDTDNVTGSCGEALDSDAVAAAGDRDLGLGSNNNFECGDEIYIPYQDEGNREKTVLDTCPICGEGDKIDHFTPDNDNCVTRDDADEGEGIEDECEDCPIIKPLDEEDSGDN